MIFTKQNDLTKIINILLTEMENLNSNGLVYENKLNTLERLYKLKMDDKKRKISPDTMAIVVGNLLGLGFILGFEKLNVITSKALNFVIRSRV